MTPSIDVIQMDDAHAWDRFVESNPLASPYHLFKWCNVIGSVYGHKTYLLAAVRHSASGTLEVIGLLPLVQMKSLLFGNRLVSMPFFDHGGILTDDPEIETALIRSAITLARQLRAQHIELRQMGRLTCLPLGDDPQTARELPGELDQSADSAGSEWTVKTRKVRMLLPLPDSSEALMRGFKSKLRSQIKRPQKAGFTDKLGGIELLDDFYHVFSINMRDLGSPVHAKRLFQQMLNQLAADTRIIVVYNQTEPIAGSIIFKFNNLISNPWASSLRKYSRESPNMMLYWRMLAYGADQGYECFDFGRSTSGEGTYRFKKQWGAMPQPIYWYTLWLDRSNRFEITGENSSNSRKRELAESIWQRLPESVARLIGPMIRRQIEL